MDESRLQEIDARATAATPGPWSESVLRDGRQPDGVEELGVVSLVDPRSVQKPDGTWTAAVVCRGMDGPTREANVAFIAHARADVPALVAEVRRLTAALATARREGAEARLREEIARARADERAACALIADAAKVQREERLAALAAEGLSQHDPARLCLVVAISDAESIAAKIRGRGEP